MSTEQKQQHRNITFVIGEKFRLSSEKREKAAVSMAVVAAALADVLITEFLISNISQKRGEGGNESGREERALTNG